MRALSTPYASMGSGCSDQSALSSYHSRWSCSRLRTAAECRASEWVQCSWKLDSSTAYTSYVTSSAMASRIGRPMLPTAAARWPAASSMDSSIWVVVVLPFVPVTACLLYTSDAADDLLCVDLG